MFVPPTFISLIEGAFATHMREHGYSSNAIARYRYYLVRVGGWLAVHRRRLTSLSRKELPRLARLMVPKATYPTLFGVLNRWLKFRQCYAAAPRESWASWLVDYGTFLKDHRGFAHQTVKEYVAFAQHYLSWQFGDREARWAGLPVQDIWRYAELCAKGYTSSYAKTRLGALRRSFICAAPVQGNWCGRSQRYLTFANTTVPAGSRTLNGRSCSDHLIGRRRKAAVNTPRRSA
jgi:hypothetical protein